MENAPGIEPAVQLPPPPSTEGVAPHNCPTCSGGTKGTARPAWIYALGNIEPKFPDTSIEKEFVQVLGQHPTSGLTDRQALHAVLSKPENRYLVRNICWVMKIGGLETYILVPRDPADLTLLVETLRPVPQPGDLDCVVGVRGPIAPPEMCGGLLVPMVGFEVIYSFPYKKLIDSIPRPGKSAKRDDVAPAGEEVFHRLVQTTDNMGATDGDRARNFLAVRSARMYELVWEAFQHNESLAAVDVRPSPIPGTPPQVDVILSFRNRTNDSMSKQSARVAVGKFPYLVKPWGPHVDIGG